MIEGIHLKESESLQNISQVSLYAAGIIPPTSLAYCFKIIQPHLVGTNLLEMGPAEGLMTDLLATTGKAMSLVDGSKLFCESLDRRFPQAKVVHALFELFEPDGLFDNIIMGHVLEHVRDPVDILKRARAWLKPGGRIFAAVPNARSLHRQAAVLMGLLPTEDALSAMDVHHGHRRVFNPESFRSVFREAGLRVDIFGGYWLKPLSNSQIESQWSESMIDAFMQMGERHPEIAGEIYVLASNP